MFGLVMALMAPAVSAAQMGGDKGPRDEATEEADQDDDDEEVDPTDWEAAGLLDDTEYESPQFGYAVEWSTDWDLDLYYDDLDNDTQPVMSNTEDRFDTIYLAWQGEANAPVWIVVTGQEANRGTPDDEIEEWTDEDWIEDQWASGIEVEVLLDDAGRDSASVLYSLVDTDNDDAQFYTMYVAVYLDDYTLYLSFTAQEDYLEDGYEALEDVEIDGDPLFQYFDWDEIEEAIG
jgi:hypothetical protein